MTNLKEQETFEYLSQIDNNLFIITFSGGKDSTVLLGLVLKYKREINPEVKIKVIFSDTYLEDPLLYRYIETIKSYCIESGIEFKKVAGEKSYWYYQFIRGYGVPNYKLRWCTSYLKVKPIERVKKQYKEENAIILTGRHFGESVTRDNKLKVCGTNDCGVDKIKSSYDPIINWSNCDVWDHVFVLETEGYLPENTFDLLSSLYNKNKVDENGSLRMGCAFCPVVSLNTLVKNNNCTDAILETRKLLEELRNCFRLSSPKSKKLNSGAVNIFDRRSIWERLPKKELISLGYMTAEEEAEISRLLYIDDITCYPSNYSPDFIESQHNDYYTNVRK